LGQGPIGIVIEHAATMEPPGPAGRSGGQLLKDFLRAW
jgi:hypothetical protein